MRLLVEILRFAQNDNARRLEGPTVQKTELLAVDTVIPRNAEGAGLHANYDLVSLVEAIKIIRVDGQALVATIWPPGIDKQSARTENDALHLIAAINGAGVIFDVGR